MPTRVFGVRDGAGVQVRERQAAKPILSGPFGSTLLIGVFQSGPVNQVVELTGRAAFTRVFGGLTPDSEAPLAALDFYRFSGGAGVLHCLRLTDGTEAQANLTLFDRRVDLSLLETQIAGRLPSLSVVLDAHSGGRWGGRRARKGGKVTLGSAVTSTTTFATGETMLADKWKGATLTFPNDAVGEEYTVLSNTTAGVLTIAGGFSANVSGGSNGTYLLELVNEDDINGDEESLSVLITDGGEAPATQWGLTAFRNGASVKGWDDLSMDSGSNAYWLSAIEDDVDNYEIDPSVSFTGDPADPLTRPANFAEIAAPGGVNAAGNEVTFQVVRWTASLSGGADCYLDTVNDVVWPSEPQPCTIVCTFTSATAFTPVVTFPDGETVSGLAAGTLDAAWASPNRWVPGFTLSAGGTAPTAGDTITIYFRPLPSGLASRGAMFYPAAAASEGDVLVSYPVRSNDHDTIVLDSSVDVSSEVTPPGAPTMTSATAGDYVLTGGETLILTVGGRANITLTESGLGAGTHSATDLAGELNARELARVSAAAIDKVFQFGVSSDDKLTVTALQDYGPDAILTIGAGTLNSIVGFTTSQVSAGGTTPTIGRLEWAQPMGGGYDGIAAIDPDTHYIEAFTEGAGTPLDGLIEQNTGLLRIAVPGITDSDVQAAAAGWAYNNNALFYAEIPDTIVTEAAAIAWLNANLVVGPRDDHRLLIWPSYAKRDNPYGSGLYTYPISGSVLGLTARAAVDNAGYHVAAAGEDLLISPTAKDLPTGDRRLDNELLNRRGIIELRKRGPRIYLWGDRIPGNGGRLFAHKRAAMSHIGRTLLTNTGSLVFLPISAATLAEARQRIRDLFRPWFVAGWFDDSAGGDFSQQVQITADESNNTAATRAAGEMHIDIAFEIVATAEKVVFSIGPNGITESS